MQSNMNCEYAIDDVYTGVEGYVTLCDKQGACPYRVYNNKTDDKSLGVCTKLFNHNYSEELN